MRAEPVPEKFEALVALATEVGDLLRLSSNEHDRLTRLADWPTGPHPVTLTSLTAGSRGGEPVAGSVVLNRGGPEVTVVLNSMNSGAEINDSLGVIARLACPVLKYLPLSAADQRDINGLVGAGAGGQEGNPAGSLLLEGMIRFDNDPPLAESVAGANRIRLTALRGLLDRLKTALAELHARVERKVHPPEVKDRVKVNVGGRVLTIDGHDYELNTTVQARVLEQMALANGKPLPGPEIARRAGLKASFMISRTLNQVKKKHPKLNRLIPLASSANNMFCFRLPTIG